ncbi:hypothetical protein LptCag_2639 [Leptospirillum ferriphilum]|nr:hypothetical protein LptCag_2639 [Leptospirillum ferriphilum]
MTGTKNISIPENEEKEPAQPEMPQKDRLIKIAREMSELFHCSGNAYAKIRRDGHSEVWPVASRTFRLFLEQQFYQQTGGSPSSNAKTEALSTIEAWARFTGKEHKVYRRVARLGENIFIDLGSPDWSCVEVSPSGWRILEESPIRFHRGGDVQPLPIPDAGGSLDDLWNFLNIKPEDQLLFLAWLVFSLMPDGPFVILVLRAFHGSGKSTTSQYILSLVDPRRGGLRAFPKDERDLAVASENGWLMGFDNLSNVPPLISDALCRLTHGAGFATRTLYENMEETIIDAKRPILLNSIGDIIERPDLADRALLLELPPLEGPRRTEAQIKTLFREKGPKIMGAILSLMAGALKELPSVAYDDLPRMADFARVGIAVEQALKFPKGSFMNAYSHHREDLSANILDHPVVSALWDLMALVGKTENSQGWDGTFKALKARLDELAPEADRRSMIWPKTPKKLGNILRNMAPALRIHGIILSFPGHSKDGSHLTINQEGGFRQSPQSPQSPGKSVADLGGDHWGDHPKNEQSPQSPGDHGDHPKNGQSPQQSPPKARTVAIGDHGDHGDHSNPPFLLAGEVSQFEEVD